MPPIAARWRVSSRILAEELSAPDEPLALLLRGRSEATASQACGEAARALLDLPEAIPVAPPWLSPHQAPAHRRLVALVVKHGGAVLADAVGLGKSYVALALALTLGAEPLLVVPAVLMPQWRALLRRFGARGRIWSHERLSRDPNTRLSAEGASPALVIVDEAHHFRNPDTRRYRALARQVIGKRVLLVTATPVHHRIADLVHLLRLFLRDDALVAVGVPTLAGTARAGQPDAATLAALTRFVVARSRHRIMTAWTGLAFPRRAEPVMVRALPAAADVIDDLVDGIRGLPLAQAAGSLFRVTLLRRLASSVPALRETLRRYEAFGTVQHEASAAGRTLSARDFRRLFPLEDGADLQLAFLPLLLETSRTPRFDPDELRRVRRLLGPSQHHPDPKADALVDVLSHPPLKTIVFVDAVATLHHLRRLLVHRFRVGAVAGSAAWLGTGRASRLEVLEAFAPRAHGVAPPSSAARVDVLIATDLAGEGLNLQDAERVVHYDLPWSPARLAQRVGRIDRLASPHARITTVTFVPPEPLASAIALEQRLARKVAAQVAVGTAQVETTRGLIPGEAALDWCDRLQPLASAAPVGTVGWVAASVAPADACVLLLRLGAFVDAMVIENGAASFDAARAAMLLEAASSASPSPLDRSRLDRAIRDAAPVLRARCAAIAAARWRAPDRDTPGRRLVPFVLASARQAARAGQAKRLARLDALVARLCSGQTAGEALLLEPLLQRRPALGVSDLLSWHERLPPLDRSGEPAGPHLVGAILLLGPARAAPGTPD